jgi:hypothetical protein
MAGGFAVSGFAADRSSWLQMRQYPLFSGDASDNGLKKPFFQPNV